MHCTAAKGLELETAGSKNSIPFGSDVKLLSEGPVLRWEKNPRTGHPIQQETRIQTNDTKFVRQFGQTCTGHEYGHDTEETEETGFYPQLFCQRAIQIWKNIDDTTPKRILKKIEDWLKSFRVSVLCLFVRIGAKRVQDAGAK